MEFNEEVCVEEQHRYCPSCNEIVQEQDQFCGHCGKGIDITSVAPIHEDVFSTLSPTLLYYFITLILLGVFKFTPVFSDGFEGMLMITILDALLVLAFCVYYFAELKSLYSFSQVKPNIVLLTICGAVVGSVVVSNLADFINISISDDVFYDIYLFEDTGYPFFFAVLFIAVFPAIFEEVAFRGFMYTNIAQATTGKATIYITGFIFGIIHLSFISLLWLVPIGLVFGWLRFRYNTLWYGMIGHFTYNLCIVLIDFW